METLRVKLNNLKKILRKLESAVLAFSGGVDSAFLLKICKDVLGDKIVAAIADSQTYPSLELTEAQKTAQRLGVEYIIIHTEELSQVEFIDNSPQRCYYCKKELFSKLKQICKKRKLDYILDGSNYDDLNDFRPGRKASLEFKVKSPLLEAKLAKSDIRTLSREINLSTWNKPSSACLASRIPYGVSVTRERLGRIEQAEQFLRQQGINQVRVRDHGDIARIEISKEDMPLFLEEDLRKKIINKLNNLGYIYITLDLQGYRSGSMNEVLGKKIWRKNRLKRY